ncbi:hypothetical protein SAMN04488505_102224 [Chitinophaga rupis]|uniref:Uncharacterized protein n=1 Tax=Chitinophaga rupis TaxID=573321 RepID=A0A1H7Q0Z0_9BACT|nr:hypothetical protein SAMN04488505_102224 [Chitinophaga rupis]
MFFYNKYSNNNLATDTPIKPPFLSSNLYRTSFINPFISPNISYFSKLFKFFQTRSA